MSDKPSDTLFSALARADAAEMALRALLAEWHERGLPISDAVAAAAHVVDRDAHEVDPETMTFGQLIDARTELRHRADLVYAGVKQLDDIIRERLEREGLDNASGATHRAELYERTTVDVDEWALRAWLEESFPELVKPRPIEKWRAALEADHGARIIDEKLVVTETGEVVPARVSVERHFRVMPRRGKETA